MGLTVRNMCEIIHGLCPTATICVQGFVDGDPHDTVALYVYPDDDDFWGEQEVVQVDVETDEHLKARTISLSVVIKGCKPKKEKTDKAKDPIKLSSVLGLFDQDEGMNICVELKNGKYLYLHGEADTLLGLDAIKDCVVDGIGSVDPDTEEEILHIRATQQ